MLQSIRTLLHGIVDYAGLFPPAKLDMARAVQNYARYVAEGHSWMLGRFVVPVARLGDFEKAAIQAASVLKWHVSALVGADAESDAAAIAAFNERNTGRLTIDSVELKPGVPSDIAGVVGSLPQGVDAFVEVPVETEPAAWIVAVRAAGANAKVRTGGVEADLIPRLKDIARFIVRCHDTGVAFKATAGLHHPIRAQYRLTYEPDSHYATMHGFLNLFVAAAVASRGLGFDEVASVLDVTNRGRFTFADASVSVYNHIFNIADIKRVRERFALSFGSCSFIEPIDELKGMDLL